jgi:hypothetical protein
MEKSRPASPLGRYYITLFWHFLVPSGTLLGGSRQVLTLFFQHFQSIRLVWNNKIKSENTKSK